MRSINQTTVVLAILWISASVRAASPSTGSVTLEECYRRALKVSEALAISDEEIRQLEAQYRKGVGAVLPEISWEMTQLWQDTSGVAQSTGGVQGTLLRERRPESHFQLQQPIFSGFKEFNAVKGLGAAREGARLKREQAALNLLSDVAEVFYTSLDLQQELDVLATQRRLTEDRLKELERRVRLGRSRESETLSAQVELASLDAQTEDTRQRWAVARQTLRFLTEVPPDVALKNDRPAPALPALQAAHDLSSRRADLLAAEQIKKQEEFRLKYAKGGYWPEVDATGKYYTERVGFNEDVKWDALLSVSVPIFSGFQTRADVKEARSRLIGAELDLARTKRLIRQQVDTAHQNLAYSLSQSAFYEKAVALAEKNYKVQQEEYRLGLINNLQVLDVLNTLQDLKLRALRVQAAAQLSDIRLRVATAQGL